MTRVNAEKAVMPVSEVDAATYGSGDTVTASVLFHHWNVCLDYNTYLILYMNS